MSIHQQIGFIACAMLALSGCAGIESRTHPAYAPMEPIVYTNPQQGITLAVCTARIVGSAYLLIHGHAR